MPKADPIKIFKTRDEIEQTFFPVETSKEEKNASSDRIWNILGKEVLAELPTHLR